MSDLLLGIDVGTSACKAAVVDASGAELAHGQAATPWETYPESVGVHAASAVTVACHEGPHNVEDHVSRHAPSLLATVASRSLARD